MSEKHKEQEEEHKQELKKRKKKQMGSQQVMAQAMAAWVLTFADLMSLLMAFFVMLFALSEVDKEKFKIMGLSMREAFGSPITQQIERNSDIPKPSQANNDKTADPTAPKPIQEHIETKAPSQSAKDSAIKKTQSDANKLKKLMGENIKNNKVSVQQRGRVIVVRLMDQGAFPSGSSDLSDDFKPTLIKVGNALKEMDGEIVVSGFTDNRPMRNHIYRSNWELSASRSYSVIQVFIDEAEIDPERLTLRGFGETRTIASNESPEGRSQNRRVEIMIDQRLLPMKKVIEKIKKGDKVDGKKIQDAIRANQANTQPVVTIPGVTQPTQATQPSDNAPLPLTRPGS